MGLTFRCRCVKCVVIETDDYNIPTPASKAAKKKAEEQSAARMASAASKPVSSFWTPDGR